MLRFWPLDNLNISPQRANGPICSASLLQRKYNTKQRFIYKLKEVDRAESMELDFLPMHLLRILDLRENKLEKLIINN